MGDSGNRLSSKATARLKTMNELLTGSNISCLG
jgi:hypothetical protein